MNIPKKVDERIRKNLPRYQKVLEIATARDINESDTVQIVTDMLSDVFGYAKYVEITSELAIRGTYCDLAIKVDNKYPYLIEVKAIGTELKDRHKKQAIDYGSNKGITWILLTNGLIWNVFRIRFEMPINYDLVFSIDMEKVNAKSDRDMELLFMLTKEGLDKNIKEEYFEKVQSVNRYIIGNMILSETMLTVLRREVKKFAEGAKIDLEEIAEIVRNDVLKRDIVEGDEAAEAQKRLKKYFKLGERRSKQTTKTDTDHDLIDESVTPEPEADEPEVEVLSITERLMREAEASEQLQNL